MKRKIKEGIYEAIIIAAMAGVFLAVGAVESFSISIGRGIALVSIFTAAGAFAVVAACKEDKR